MLDPWVMKLVNSPLTAVARILKKKKIQPDQVTLAGFGMGLVAFLSI